MRAMFRVGASLAVVMCLGQAATAAAAKPIFASKTVTSETPGHAVDIEADITGAKRLYLVVTDGGNGFSCDWADWAEPRLVGPSGEKKLTDLKWHSANAQWGQVRVNANAEGGALRIAGKRVEYGIGTHANSLIVFDLPEGFTKFRARGGLDNGGTDQGGGGSTSVNFLVYTEAPDPQVLQGAAAGELREPEFAVDGLDVGDGLEATLFAAEPMMFSPSNIDIDHRGRVWVCEVVNYRHFRNQNNPVREEGDRILILEDTDGDAQADKSTVFYQGTDIDSAHGVCVLGNRAIVSAGDSVLILTDTDGDDRADKKDVLFSGIAGTQHDHGIHSFLFGPDGKLYFNFGNSGNHLYDKEGNPIVDKAGNVVKADRQPYQEGMAFRCNLDGSELETLGWNFRNNWELAVDSFGNIWQSDNDDDGNRGVRINFVVEYGNYGYKDELTGAGWREPRTGMHEEIPLRHWHLNDPGVMPNLLQTGAGSPTGIIRYEGTLLPEKYRGALIHCDAGPNVVRAYLLTEQGGGYSAEIANILEGARDKWFRPSDVCVAPDGSLIVADWYDPGVGGHAQGDPSRGRLFRVAPPKSPYKMPTYDFTTAQGAALALHSPNKAAQYLAWTALHDMGADAKPALDDMWRNDPRLEMRVRAMWLLGYLPGEGDEYVRQATWHDDPQVRIAGLRLARRLGIDVLPIVERLKKDPSPQVVRECLIALSESKSDAVPRLWADIAMQIDVHDRWLLESLGIAARGRWDACLQAYFERAGDQIDERSGFLIWRSRATNTPALLAKTIRDPGTPAMYLPFLFRAFDFQAESPAKQEVLTALAFEPAGRPDQQAFISGEALQRVSQLDFAKHPEYKTALDKVLDTQQGTLQFISLVDKFQLEERYPQLLELGQSKPDTQEGVAAVGLLIDKRQWPLLREAIHAENPQTSAATLEVLGNTGKGGIQGLLLPIVKDGKADPELRRQAARALTRARNGAIALVELAQQKQLDDVVKEAVAAGLHTAQWGDVKEQALKLFPPPPSKNNRPLPPIEELVKRGGDVQRGKLLFNTEGTCAKCHVVNQIGKEVGPNLDEIGSKLSRQALFESIVFPSAGISHNYENYLIVTEDGTTVNGIMVSETPDSVTLKGADAIPKTVKKSEIEEMIKQKISLMPADLQKVLTEQDLVDVVDYLQTLKKKVSE